MFCLTHFGKNFYHEWLVIYGIMSSAYNESLSDAFLHLLRSCGFVYSFLYMVYHIHLHTLNHSCELGMNFMWVVYMIFFMYCWIWFVVFLLRIVASIFIMDIDGQFSVFGVTFVWFWYQGGGDLIECV